MALEMLGVNWSSFDDVVVENQENGHVNMDHGTQSSMSQYFGDWGMNASADGVSRTRMGLGQTPFLENQTEFSTPAIFSKDCWRRRSKEKNKKVIENQRMTHIAVERNRRKQMNEYLSVLRGLMPQSYSQQGDQASIIGGAINYVKELEQQLHFLSGQKSTNENHEKRSSSSSQPFEEFFIFPQYSRTASTIRENLAIKTGLETGSTEAADTTIKVDIEVTIVDGYANLKIRSKKRFKKLSKMVRGLESLKLSVLHLNVTTANLIVLYSLSLKVEDECMLRSSEDIAGSVNCMLHKIGGENDFQVL